MTDILDNDSEIIDRKLLFINDNNNGSYNGQITYNLQSLANTNSFLNFQEAYLEIPFCISMKVNADINLGDDFGASLNENIMKMVTIKDGYQIIDNVQLSVGGRIIHQEHKFNNVHSYYLKLMSFSKDFIEKNNSSYGMYVDTIDQKQYSSTSSYHYMPEETFYNSQSSSVLRRNRELLHSESLNYGYVPDNREIKAVDITTDKLTGCSFYERVGNRETTSTNTYYWVYFCTIPLRDIAQYFKNVPLTRSSDMQLIVTYNSTNVEFVSRMLKTQDAAPGPPILVNTYTTTIVNQKISQISGNTCPYTITINTPIQPLTANFPPAVGNNVDITLTFQSNIGKTSHGQPTNMAFNNTRLYVPSYKLSPERSLTLSQIPQNIVEYNDIFTFSIIDKQPSEIIREVLSTGIVNPQYVMVIPFYAKNTNRNPEWQNCFDTCPATSSNIPLLEFQIELGSENIFKADISYNFSMYDQISSIFALNKNIDNQRSSGVLTKYLWENSHRCYIADLSRRNRSDDLVTKSVTLSCKNGGVGDAGRVSLLVFIAYKRSVKLNGATGLIED
jgi:hypothetical protein